MTYAEALFARFMKNIFGVTNFDLEKCQNSTINLLRSRHWGFGVGEGEGGSAKNNCSKEFYKNIKMWRIN